MFIKHLLCASHLASCWHGSGFWTATPTQGRCHAVSVGWLVMDVCVPDTRLGSENTMEMKWMQLQPQGGQEGR